MDKANDDSSEDDKESVMEGGAKEAKLWPSELSTVIAVELKVLVAGKNAEKELKNLLAKVGMAVARKLEELVAEKCAEAEKKLEEQLGRKGSDAQRKIKDLLADIGAETGQELVGLVKEKDGEAKKNLEELLEQIDAEAGNLKLKKMLAKVGMAVARKLEELVAEKCAEAKKKRKEQLGRKGSDAQRKSKDLLADIGAETGQERLGLVEERGAEIAKKFEKQNMYISIIVVIALALLVAFLLGSNRDEVGESANDFEAKVVELQRQFRNQNQFLWNALGRLGKEHIVEYFNASSLEPSRPLVFVLVSTPDNSEELNCFSKSVAGAFLNKGDYSLLDGSDIVQRSQSKPDVDVDIERILKSSSTYPVLLFKDLGSLPYDVASLFFKYCDNEDAPYPQAVFIFTLTIDGDNSVLSSSSRKEITAKSYEYLTTVAWKDAEKAKTDALIARIVNPYPLPVVKEDSSMLKEVC